VTAFKRTKTIALSVKLLTFGKIGTLLSARGDGVPALAVFPGTTASATWRS